MGVIKLEYKVASPIRQKLTIDSARSENNSEHEGGSVETPSVGWDKDHIA